MPGICGAIKLEAGRGDHDPGELVSLMLSSMAAEPWYVTKRWECPSGNASMASFGLENLQRSIDGAPRFLEGLSYGQARIARNSGDKWLESLRGSFSMAVRDTRDGSYTVAADRRSSEPVYYAQVSGFLCFAPEVRALLALPGLSRRADQAALAALVTSGHLLEDMTLFRAVRRLTGGQALRVVNGAVRKLVYWQFSPGAAASPGEKELLERLDHVLRSAVEVETRGTAGDTAVFLSGGCDSRVILGYARDVPDLRTVSWGLEETAPGTDAEIARKLASVCGVGHHFLRRETADYAALFEEAAAVTEYQSDVAAFHPQEFRLMRGLREAGFRRVIRGDETFGWKKLAPSVSGALARVGLRRFGLIEGLSGCFHPDVAQLLVDESENSLQLMAAKAAEQPANRLKDYLYFTQRLQNYLNSCAIFKQRWFEHVNPLLADDALELLSLVPDDLRTDKRLLRLLVERKFPALHALGYARADGLEKWPVLWKTDSPVRCYLQKQLADASSGVWEIYDQPRLQSLFEGGRDSVGYRLGGRVRRGFTRLARDVCKPVWPQAADELQASLALRAPMDNTKILFRFLVVKQWVDRFSPILR